MHTHAPPKAENKKRKPQQSKLGGSISGSGVLNDAAAWEKVSACSDVRMAQVVTIERASKLLRRKQIAMSQFRQSARGGDEIRQ